MAGRFVRASKYRHVFGKPAKKEATYDNLHISRNAWDTNLVKANPEYISINWEASGGGAFAVIPVNEKGRLPEQLPLFRGHTAAVLDTDWNPFNDRIIASGSDDGKVFVWEVPQGFSLYSDAEEPQDVAPASKLTGHSRKVGHVLFNPSAENILASSSGDYTVKLWDVGTGQSPLTLKHKDVIQSLSWSADGNMLVTTSRDKRLRIWDVRTEKAVHDVQSHSGAKNCRAVWMGEHNRIATTGFSKMSDRQMALWDVGNPTEPIGGFTTLDSGSGVCMPFWDEGTQCLYLAGKGDGNIRYFEYENDKFEFLSEYKSSDPQRGLAFVPRRGLNLHENEVMRAYKTVNDAYIEPISFTVPRRAEVFQSDIFPPAVGNKAGLSAADWLSGKNGVPAKIDLESVYEGNAPVPVATDYKPPPKATEVSKATEAPKANDVRAPSPVRAPEPMKAPEPVKEKAPEAAPSREIFREGTASERKAAYGAPPSMADQKQSMSALASKFQDTVEDEAEDDDSSNFEQVSRPAPRNPVASGVVQPLKKAESFKTSSPPPRSPATTSPIVKEAPKAADPVTISQPSPTASSANGTSIVEDTLQEIKKLLEMQTKTITDQNTKIEKLTNEVSILKIKAGNANAGQDQSERIRELELELEAARS